MGIKTVYVDLLNMVTIRFTYSRKKVENLQLKIRERKNIGELIINNIIIIEILFVNQVYTCLRNLNIRRSYNLWIYNQFKKYITEKTRFTFARIYLIFFFFSYVKLKISRTKMAYSLVGRISQ